MAVVIVMMIFIAVTGTAAPLVLVFVLCPLSWS